MKERKESVVHANLPALTRQREECKYVCSGGASSVSITIKEAVFCNCDWTYLLCCPIPHIMPVTKEDR